MKISLYKVNYADSIYMVLIPILENVQIEHLTLLK